MAAIVGAIPRLFQPTIGILSGEKVCRGINPWYFLIGVRMVTLYFAFAPCQTLHNDLICKWISNVGDAKAFCSAICYNQHFPMPISSTWAFYFITIIFIVALMKFVHISEKKPSAKDPEAAGKSTQDPPATFSGWRYGIYIFCIALILTMEVGFICIVLGLQLPIMNQAVVMCYPNNVACPPSAQCTLSVQSDKQTVLWALAFCAAVNACVCIVYLAVFGAQACYGGCGSKGKARPGRQGNCAREAVRHGCLCNREGCNFCHDSSSGHIGPHDYGVKSGTGMAGCTCQPEKLDCCCHPQGSGPGRDGASGCLSNRQGSSQSLMPHREDSEGKLLRGDTELVGERQDWRPEDGRIPVRDLLRGGAKKSRGSPGREGRVVRYVAKYQTRGKRKM